MKPLPAAELLRQLFSYDSTTGILCHAVGKRAGMHAGTENGKGYLVVRINDIRFRVHRLVFKIFHGSDPVGALDHMDGCRSNNRIANLREASISQNNQNCKMHRDNASGYKSVSWSWKMLKWRAEIMCNGKRSFLGYFDSADIASQVYANAAAKLFGEFHRKPIPKPIATPAASEFELTYLPATSDHAFNFTTEMMVYPTLMKPKAA